MTGVIDGLMYCMEVAEKPGNKCEMPVYASFEFTLRLDEDMPIMISKLVVVSKGL